MIAESRQTVAGVESSTSFSIQGVSLNNKVTIVSGSVVAALLSACGGGGSSDSTPASTLSQTQQNYESAALASNGGLHSVQGSLTLSTSATGVLTVSPSSHFYSADSSLAQSPSSAPQARVSGYTDLASTIALPTFAAFRVVVNGTVYVSNDQASVSYSGNNVVETIVANDGKTVVETVVATGYGVVPLSGTIAGSPAELFTSPLGLITNTLNGQSLYNTQANWQSGSAYIKATRNIAGDTLRAADCESPRTTGSATTPCGGPRPRWKPSSRQLSRRPTT